MDGGDKAGEVKINYFQLSQPATLSMCPQATQVLLTLPPTPTPAPQSDTHTRCTCAHAATSIYCATVFLCFTVKLLT